MRGLALVVVLVACAGENPARREIDARRAASQAPTPVAADWTCPMHLDVSSPGPGSCPKCAMPLVERGK